MFCFAFAEKSSSSNSVTKRKTVELVVLKMGDALVYVRPQTTMQRVKNIVFRVQFISKCLVPDLAPRPLPELGHLLGDPSMFVRMCFLKPDPTSEACEGQKHNCLTGLLKIKTKLKEQKGRALLR